MAHEKTKIDKNLYETLVEDADEVINFLSEETDDEDEGTNPKVADKNKSSASDKDEYEDKDSDDDDDEADEDENVKESYREEDQPDDIVGNTPEEILRKLRDSMNPIINDDATLTEEFKSRISTIIEAAVMEEVKTITKTMNEEFKARINKEVEEVKEDLGNKINRYLGYVAEEWKNENRVAIETGMRLELAENFLTGMKTLFEENYVSVPAEKINLVEQANAKVAELEEKLAEEREGAMALSEQLVQMKKDQVFAEASEGLTETDKERFKGLVEDFRTSDLDTFKKKVSTIRESFFKEASDGKDLAKKITENIEGDSKSMVSNKTTNAIDASLKKAIELSRRGRR